MNNNNPTEVNSSSEPHKPLVSNAGSYSTFPEHTQVAMAAHHPPLVPLSQLKNQSAFIQCPHCLNHVYTKISGADFSDVLFIFPLVHFFFPLDLDYLGKCLITAFFWLILWFMYTGHACPSCDERIASYNALKRVLGITAPAIVTTTSTSTSSDSNSNPPPLYYS